MLVHLIVLVLVHGVVVEVVCFHMARGLSKLVTTASVTDELAFLGEGVKELLGVDVGGERLNGAVEVTLGEDGVRITLTYKG